MSWDIVLFNSRQRISAPEDINEDQLVPCDFDAILKANFKKITENDGQTSINGDGFTIDYYYDGEPASNIMLSLYGEPAIYPVIDVALKNNWQIFDTGLGEMIDLHNPAQNGYQNFQAYLNQILNNNT